jgi:hypothetical protein
MSGLAARHFCLFTNSVRRSCRDSIPADQISGILKPFCFDAVRPQAYIFPRAIAFYSLFRAAQLTSALCKSAVFVEEEA